MPCRISIASNTVSSPTAMKKRAARAAGLPTASRRTSPVSSLGLILFAELERERQRSAKSRATAAPTVTQRLSHPGAGK